VLPQFASRRAILTTCYTGVHGIAHVAGDVSFSSNPDDVIPGVINSVHSILEAASKEKTVTRFVITSSSTAATMPKPNKKFTIDENSWNEEAVADAYKEPNAWNVYSASKTRGEQEVCIVCHFTQIPSPVTHDAHDS